MSRRSERDGDVLVIGWGNILLSDEGVGIHALHRLERDYSFEPRIGLVDGGTSGLDLLPLFSEHARIVMLDAVALDRPAGAIATLRDGEIRRALTGKLSVHHLGISDVLAVAELLDYRPKETVLVGIVPECLELGLELSPKIAERLPSLVETTLSILQDWGVRVEERKTADTRTEPVSII